MNFRVPIAMLVAARTISNAATSTLDFNGNYTDENHKNCPRTIDVLQDEKHAVVRGKDGDPDCNDTDGTPWVCPSKVDGDIIIIDFSSKGGGVIGGRWEDGEEPGILFEDGNKWYKINKVETSPRLKALKNLE